MNTVTRILSTPFAFEPSVAPVLSGMQRSVLLREPVLKEVMEQSLRNERRLVGTVFVCFAGMYFIMPFLPLYVQELGGYDPATTVVWSGAILAATPLVSGMAAPFWGLLADKFGRRIMLQRSLVGFALCLGAMGLATEPWHLLAIRAVEGLFGGFMASAAALVSTTSPPERLSIGIGRVHAARVLGMAAGPIPGGVMADFLGYRYPFFAAMSFVFIAFIIVTLMTSKPANTVPEDNSDAPPPPRLRSIVGTGAFISIFLAVLVTRMAERSFDPVLPFLVSEAVSIDRVASITSVITATGLVASSIAAALVGQFVDKQRRARALLLILVLTALLFAPIPFLEGWGWLLAVRATTGALLGASLTLAVSLAASDAPLQRRSFVLGIIGSGTSYGSALGFMLAGALSPIALTLVFAIDSILIFGCAAVLLWGRGWQR